MAILRDLREMPRFQQFALAGAGALVLFAILASIWVFFLRTQYAVLFSNLRSVDAAGIVAELDSKKIPYRLADGGTTILIPADRVDSARLDVTSGDIPLKGQVGFELFNKSDMGLTDFAQKINYQRALQGELARTIMTMDSVDSARVHLSISEHSIFRDDRIPPKASVTIVPREGHRISEQAVRGIQRLVAAAVPELEPANVVVIGEDGDVLGNNLDQETETPERRFVEQKYAENVRRFIKGIVPLSSTVAVWAGPSNRYEELLPGPRRLSPGAEGRRDFPLEVTISLQDPISDTKEEELRSAAIAALGLPNAGDSVTIDVTPAGTVASVNAPKAATVLAGAPPDSDVSSVAIRAGLGAVALALAAIMLVPLTRRRKLSEAQRARFAETFRSLLAEEQADA